MCGIGVSFAYRRDAPLVDREGLLRMRAAQRLRGPDDEGVWFSDDGRVGLVHSRLSILDLTQAGAQPMCGADGTTRVVFNGEIYNMPELRTELEGRGCVFGSHSDTEVLLHLYRLEGRSMVSRLRGMFAFAIWDSREQALFLARDPLGIKPLYVADDGKTLRAASQVKALLAGGGIDTSVDPAGHVGFFLWGHVASPHTLYRGIRSLPAGTTLWVKRDQPPEGPTPFFNLGRVLSACEQEAPDLSRPEMESRLGAALEDSIQHHMLSDVPVGVFLSAGLDSSTIAMMASRHTDQPLRTVTLGFEEFRGKLNDETVLAEETARKLGFDHHTHCIRQRDFEEERAHIIDVMDQPSVDGVNTYFVSRAAKAEGLKVVLSGLGGDELLGSYDSFRQIPQMVKWARPMKWAGPLIRRSVAPWIGQFTSPKYAGLLEFGGTYGGAYLLRRGLFMPWELDGLLDSDLVQAGWKDLCVLEALEDTVKDIKSPRLKITALELSWYMRNQLLRDSDWASMAHSLELRVPLVDVELLRAVASLSTASSPLPKRAMASTITNCLPVNLLNRPKTGFEIPIGEWIRSKVPGRGLRGWARWLYQNASLSGC